MTQVKPDTVTKAAPFDTWTADCAEDVIEGDPIYLDTSGEWNKATGATVSTLATHVALTDGSATPDGTGNDTTKRLTGIKYGQVRLLTALANIGGHAFLGDTAGRYGDVPGTQSQILGVIVDKNGKIVQLDIQQVNNNL